MALITLADIRASHTRIAPAPPSARRSSHLIPARLKPFGISGPLATRSILKDESAQPIGSFKLRGAYNKIAQLTPDQLSRGVITYSSGNHAQGVAYAARALGSKAVIVMPESAPRVKRDATAAFGAEIVLVGNASSDRKQKAEALAVERGLTIVPPYDDPAIIAGQATCGLEILEQCPNIDLVLSPVSGGGLLSGVSTAIKLSRENRVPHSSQSHRDEWDSQDIQVWGCEPQLAADATESFTTKKLVEWPAAYTTRTLCDGLRTQSLGELNFEHILAFTDGIVTVSEAEIRLATRILLDATDIVAEPSGAITLAAALFHAHELPASKTIVAIVSGGNIDPTLRTQLESEPLTTTV